ncbi:MAG: FKBP-type peptidyl-prolyl cis-trans isomerase [Rikenellaceae bacterium]
MAKKPNRIYVAKNKAFLEQLKLQEDVMHLSDGVLYKVINNGEGKVMPKLNSVVSVHYKGSLTNGYVFDSTLNNGYPETFRLYEVIDGWQVAMQKMCVGDKWIVYIPSDMGYGDRAMDDIPGGSTLIFEIELLAIN